MQLPQEFDDRHWWTAIVIFGSGFLVASVIVKEYNLVVIALGIVVLGLGESYSHPMQINVRPNVIATSYPRKFSWLGLLLDVTGLALIATGIYRFMTL